MFTTITIRFQAEDRGEMIDSYGRKIADARVQYERLLKSGALGDPEKVALRFLLIGGKWKAPITEEEAE